MSQDMIHLTDLTFKVTAVKKSLVRQLPRLQVVRKDDDLEVIGVYIDTDDHCNRLLVTLNGEPFYSSQSLFGHSLQFKDNHWTFNGERLPYIYLD